MAGLTVFDILVLLALAGGIITGLLRGFVQEVLSLGALIAALFALRLFHTPVTAFLADYLGGDTSASVLAFALLVGGVWGGGKLIAARIGASSRKSLIGPADRLLGGGFGALKGLLIASVGYMLFTLAYDLMFGGEAARPAWLAESRTYPLMRATGSALSDIVAERISARDERADSTP